jgi:hypothetical protein
MRRKNHLMILTILALSTVAINMSFARSFEIPLQRGEILIWKCNLCRSVEMNEVFGENWTESGFFENISTNRLLKMQLEDLSIFDHEENLSLTIWTWQESDRSELAGTNSTLTYFTEPESYPQNYTFPDQIPFLPFILPSPTGEFIGKIKFNPKYAIDNRVLPTINLQVSQNSISMGYPMRSVTIIAIYNERGVVSSYKILLANNSVLIDISLAEIPPHVVAFTILLVITFIIGIIIFIKYRPNKNN